MIIKNEIKKVEIELTTSKSESSSMEVLEWTTAVATTTVTNRASSDIVRPWKEDTVLFIN